jgi:hypothetical protein
MGDPRTLTEDDYQRSVMKADTHEMTMTLLHAGGWKCISGTTEQRFNTRAMMELHWSVTNLRCLFMQGDQVASLRRCQHINEQDADSPAEILVRRVAKQVTRDHMRNPGVHFVNLLEQAVRDCCADAVMTWYLETGGQ